MREAASVLRRLLDAVERGELDASPVLARLMQGAAIGLETASK